MKPTLVKPIIAALTLGACMSTTLAATSYQYRVPVPGLTVNGVGPASPVPSAVGNGVATAGACATGAATNCVAWNPAGLSSAITLSGSPLLHMTTSNCHGSIACNVQPPKGFSSGKWYWELTLSEFNAGYGGLLIGVAPLGTRLDTGSSIFYYTYSTGLAYFGGSQLTTTNGGVLLGDVYGFALDMDARALAVYRNGLPLFSSALPAGVPNMTPTVGEDWYLFNGVTANFGQSNFKYPVPAGYNAGLW